MNIFSNLLTILRSWVFPSKAVMVTGPIYMYSTNCPPEDILKTYIDPETNEEVFYFDGPISRPIVIDQIINDLHKKESLIVTNFLDEKSFKEIIYVLDKVLEEDTLLQKKKLKPKDFEAWLLEKIDLVIQRLVVQKRVLYSS